MPRLSDSMTEGTIVRWLKADGEQVRDGEEIVEIETDKATMGYEAEANGVLHILAQEGTTLAVGAVIGTVGEAAGNGAATADAEPATASRIERADATNGAAGNGAGTPSRKLGASPIARRLADGLGIELATVAGSGPYGRILKRDVVKAAQSRDGNAPAAMSPAPSPIVSKTAAVPAVGRPSTTEPTSRVQRLIAQRMVDSRATVPEFHVEVEVDMTAAIDLRRQLAEITETPPSFNDIIIKASAVALRRHPRVNGSYGDGGFEFHPMVDIGVAVAVDGGLLVPTVRQADTKTLGAIAHETRELVRRGRDGAITAAELENATFTVSNLGMFGVVRFEAIINAPQAAILSAGAIIQKPVAVNGEVEVRPIMSLTLACDHRIVYGADAAAFLADLRGLLERPLAMAL